ncbi:MAG: hypothetical protein C0501_24055 [Isosphaera sp.]|nr:hypothetical protein [Isosphaera sp.]
MTRARTLALAGLLVLSAGLAAQEPKKDDPPAKVKGYLPPNWKALGLSDEQKQQVYKIQAKYDAEIEKLEAKIAELKATMSKERKAVLTPDQTKLLEKILLKDK